MQTFHFNPGSGEFLSLVLPGLIIIAWAAIPPARRLGRKAARENGWKRLGAAAAGAVLIGAAFILPSGFSRLTALSNGVMLGYEMPDRDVVVRKSDISSTRWATRRSQRWSTEQRRLVIATIQGKTYRSAWISPEAASAMADDIDRLFPQPPPLYPGFPIPSSPPDTTSGT